MKTGERSSGPGFGGTITNTSLHDVIQLICIGRNTCRMRVRCGKDAGTIYFRQGEIVHAECGTMKGEQAFFTILSWALGDFECDDESTTEQTIRESWDFLLMESVRRIDDSINS